MKREEAYKTFKEKEVEPLVNKYLLELEEDFQQNKDKYAEEIILKFKKSFIKLSELQQTKQVKETAYIIATALRTSFYQKDYTLKIKAYNKFLYLDNESYDIGECNIKCIMESYDKLYETLLKEQKKYIGKLCATDIRNLLRPCLKSCIEYSLKLCKYAIPEIVASEEYKKIDKAEKIKIFAEEYMEEKIPLYVENQKRNIEEIKENIIENVEEELIFADYSNLDLSGIDFKGLDLSNSNFNNCIINNVNFEESILIGCTFCNAKIKNSNFQLSCIIEASFKNAEITDTTFKEAIGFAGGVSINKWEYVGYLPIDFTEVKMERVSFAESTIIRAKFTNIKQKSKK